MSDNTRHKAKNSKGEYYTGVYYRIRKRIGGPGDERVYYVTYKRNGKVTEAQVGRQYRDNMTAAKANTERGLLIEGKAETGVQKRAKAQEHVWTMGTLWDDYLAHKLAGQPATKSLDVDRRRYLKYLAPLIAKLRPEEITKDHVEKIKRGITSLAPQTRKHVLALVKRIARYGQKHRQTMPLLCVIEPDPVDNKVTEDLTPEQVESLLQALEDDENQAVADMMRLALVTGMRKGEIYKLKWDHLSFHRLNIRIVSPKGGQEAIIPMNSAAREILERQPRTSDFVFPGKDGGVRSEKSRPKAFNRIKTKAGLPSNFRAMHGLRHFFATELVNAGEELLVVQTLLTHKSPQMTMRYVEVRDTARRESSEKAARIFQKKR